jgi:nucleotide-binding universal stress UspA family protein
MKVLFAVDGSASSFDAVAQVAPLATAGKDQVAFYCAPPRIRRAGAVTSPDVLARARQGLVDAVFDEARARLPEPLRASVETITSPDDPRTGIVAAGERWGAELLVVGARGLGTFERLLVGSVSRSVVHSAKIPVWVARANPARTPPQPWRILLACEDPERGCPPADVLKGLSWPAGSSVRTITIVPSMFAGKVPDWLQQQARSPDVEEMVRAWAREHDEELRSMKARMSDFCATLPAALKAEPTVAEGEPSGVILSTIAREKIDVAVLGHRRQNWLTSRLLGSTSEAVLNHAKCSVVIVPFQQG